MTNDETLHDALASLGWSSKDATEDGHHGRRWIIDDCGTRSGPMTAREAWACVHHERELIAACRETARPTSPSSGGASAQGEGSTPAASSVTALRSAAEASPSSGAATGDDEEQEEAKADADADREIAEEDIRAAGDLEDQVDAALREMDGEAIRTCGVCGQRPTFTVPPICSECRDAKEKKR